MTGSATQTQLTALVLAASRKGTDDPVALLQNKSHKCLVEIDGIAMLERVVQTLIDSACFKRILVSIENEKLLHILSSTRNWLEAGTIEFVPSAENLTDSLLNLSAIVRDLQPLIITTADNALHTSVLIQEFVASFLKLEGDIAVAATREQTVIDEYPHAKLGFFRFRDGGYSFCNLYGIRTTSGLNAATIFRSGGQFRKRPWRILKSFGIMPMLLYRSGLISFDGFFRKISTRLGLDINPVILSYAYAPIDVDNSETFEFCDRILKQREGLIDTLEQ